MTQPQRKLSIKVLVTATLAYSAIAIFDPFAGDMAGSSEQASRTTEIGKIVPKAAPPAEQNVILNDPVMKKNWGLLNTDSQKAWRLTQGSRAVVVAVIDTGVDPQHPDLKNNLWVNVGETGRDRSGRDKATNGIDDDKNGFVDDVNGWNFAGENGDISDNHGHGSHIAGIIGAEGGNRVGISGVSPKVSLMILKYYDPKAPGVNNLRNTVRAIRYATRMGARIINYSGGGLEQSASERQAIEEAQRRGVLFVAAAGNEQSNSDQKPYYPADYDLDNILSVTAIDQSQQVLSSSNFGRQSVDIAAPGFEIYSTMPRGQYGLMTGTSQATAFATGVAALLYANNPQLNAFQVKRILTSTGDVVEHLQSKTRYRKKINSYRALAIVDQGMGLNGIIAANTGRISEVEFAADQSDSRALPARGNANISPLLEIVRHTGPDASSRAPLIENPRGL
jgi:subtilisin family serine protease